jgi:hypothetical protein
LLRNRLDKIDYLRYNYVRNNRRRKKLTVRVKKGGIEEKNGIAVRVVLISNETVGMALVKGNNGRVVEPSHSRFRDDGKQVRTPDDLDIPLGDYKQMFYMAGGILGKQRRKKAQ